MAFRFVKLTYDIFNYSQLPKAKELIIDTEKVIAIGENYNRVFNPFSETKVNQKAFYFRYENNIYGVSGMTQTEYINLTVGNSVLYLANMQGDAALGYPVGVFNINNTFLGEATNATEVAALWNADAVNKANGVLFVLGDKSFILEGDNKNMVKYIKGLRFYSITAQSNTNITIVTTGTAYVKAGTQAMVKADTFATGNSDTLTDGHFSQSFYPKNKTYRYKGFDVLANEKITVYHNDTEHTVGFGNFDYMKNLSGNFPQKVMHIRSGGRGNISNNVKFAPSNVLNWGSLLSVESMNFGDNGGGGSTIDNKNYIGDFTHMRNLTSLSCWYNGESMQSWGLTYQNFPSLRVTDFGASKILKPIVPRSGIPAYTVHTYANVADFTADDMETYLGGLLDRITEKYSLVPPTYSQYEPVSIRDGGGRYFTFSNYVGGTNSKIDSIKSSLLTMGFTVNGV